MRRYVYFEINHVTPDGFPRGVAWFGRERWQFAHKGDFKRWQSYKNEKQQVVIASHMPLTQEYMLFVACLIRDGNIKFANIDLWS